MPSNSCVIGRDTKYSEKTVFLYRFPKIKTDIHLGEEIWKYNFIK